MLKSNASNLQSFPSMDSESEREEDADSSDKENEEDITEVAVSEKALKFKIATESSFDYSSASRKGSRENKSECSSHSTSAGNNATAAAIIHAANSPCKEDDEFEGFGTSGAILHTPKVDIIPTHGHFIRNKEGGEMTTLTPTTASSSSTSTTTSLAKTKSKDSFFSRLKLFTERLSSSVDSGGPCSTTGPCGYTSTPNKVQQSHQGFSYFRRSGRKADAKPREQHCSSSGGAHDSSGGTSYFRRNMKHRGSSSDPEGQMDYVRKAPTTDSKSKSAHFPQGDVRVAGSELVSPECSPALSSASGGAMGTDSKARWKHCSGSLDSILSKEEPTKSPSRRLVLPRFSSFVQKKTRLGFKLRHSPRHSDQSS